MRRMYSESQIHKIAAEEAGKLDKVIPTGIGATGDELYLEHDSERLDGQKNVHFKQLFGKHTLIGEGNIDLYYHSIHIYIEGAHEFEWYGSITSSSDLEIDSPQDLITVCAGKVVMGSGYVDINGGTRDTPVGCLIVGNTIAETSFAKLNAIGELKFSEVASAKIEDVKTTV